MSMSNNIAEGSGSSSKKEFRQFLNIARRSTFENANILILLQRRKLITKEALDRLLDELDRLCRQITSFQKSLKQFCSLPFALLPSALTPVRFSHLRLRPHRVFISFKTNKIFSLRSLRLCVRYNRQQSIPYGNRFFIDSIVQIN